MAGKPTVNSRAKCSILYNVERTRSRGTKAYNFHNVIRIWLLVTLKTNVSGKNIEIFDSWRSTLLQYWTIRAFPSNFLQISNQMNICHLNSSSLYFKTMRDSKIWPIAANNRKWSDDFIVQNQNGRTEQTSQPSNLRPNWIKFGLRSIACCKIIESFLKGIDLETSYCNIA